MVKADYLGHSCWRLSDGTHTLLIDPWLNENPKAAVAAEEIEQADAILVSHAHFDHLGDTVSIAKRTGATVVSTFELVTYCGEQGAENGHGMNLGGAHEFPWGKVKLVQAFHTSSCGSGDDYRAMGEPCGFILQFGGLTIYHSGDTALFGDMELLGRLYPMDFAMLPIGDNFTMGPDDALEAVRLLQPKRVAPMHFNTFPVIEVDAEAWGRRVGELGVECRVLQPGESWEIGE
ncbi:MAG: metal-dependent hydrolase [Armatimonadetes bacterium]|nr:metal-dependent hydrolase [Armatimonadota bacterium]